MRREHVELDGAVLIAYGHYGRPVLAFPAEQGRAWDFENNGMIAAVADLIDAGRVKLYCVDSADAWTWSDVSVPIEERARRHGQYEAWIHYRVLPWIAGDCHGATDVVTVGCSLGAYHAANFSLKRADLFPVALCLSGTYDPMAWHAWGERGDATYFNDPMSYVANMDGDHLDWLRSRVSLLLVVGRGAWEVDPTGALPSTLAFAHALSDKGIPHELDVWDADTPHDWPSWRAQIAKHLPRLC